MVPFSDIALSGIFAAFDITHIMAIMQNWAIPGRDQGWWTFRIRTPVHVFVSTREVSLAVRNVPGNNFISGPMVVRPSPEEKSVPPST